MCRLGNSAGAGRFAITNTKLYIPVVTLLTQDITKLLQQLKPGFKKTINWNKYESYPRTFTQNQYLNHLVDPVFPGVNIFFVWSLENEDGRTSHLNFYLPKVTIKNYTGMIDGKSFFDEPID